MMLHLEYEMKGIYSEFALCGDTFEEVNYSKEYIEEQVLFDLKFNCSEQMLKNKVDLIINSNIVQLGVDYWSCFVSYEFIYRKPIFEDYGYYGELHNILGN